MAPLAGLEPATNGLEDRCSVQVSYRGSMPPTAQQDAPEGTLGEDLNGDPAGVAFDVEVRGQALVIYLVTRVESPFVLLLHDPSSCSSYIGSYPEEVEVKFMSCRECGGP